MLNDGLEIGIPSTGILAFCVVAFGSDANITKH